jgi:hypothetical protein
VLVIDVDHYDDKHGMDTIDRATDWLGMLPETYRVTSRGVRNPSGRYLYRIPDDLVVTDSSLYQFADDEGNTHVEIVRTGHRFSWAPGDFHYKNDELIRCFDPFDDEDELPYVTELPELPEKWVEYFRNPPVPQRHESYTRPSDGAEWWLSQADASLGTDSELAGFAYNMLLSRVSREEIWEQWARVARSDNPNWLWERKDFDRHLGARAEQKADTALAHQDEAYEYALNTPGMTEEKLHDISAKAAAEYEATKKLAEHREARIVQATQFQQNFSVTPLEYEEETHEYFEPVQAAKVQVDIAALIRGTPEYDRQYKYTLARMQAEKDVAKVLARDFVDYEIFDTLPPAPAPALLKVTGKDNPTTSIVAPRTVTVLSGKRASGKTWVAATWASQLLIEGGHVIWIDFERQNRLLREKFTALGIQGHLLKRQFHYTGGMPPIGRIVADIATWASRGREVLVVVDAFRGLQALIAPGTSANDGDAVEAVYMEVLNEVVASARPCGGTVAIIDHVTKAGTAGTFGSERKESAADYVINVEQQKVFSRNSEGYSVLTVTKDRYGHIPADTPAGYLWMPSGDRTGSGPSIDQYPGTPELRNWSPAEAAELEAVELSLKGQREATLTELVAEAPLRLSINKLSADALEGYPELFPSESSTKRYIRDMIKEGKLVKEQGNTGKLDVPAEPDTVGAPVPLIENLSDPE